MSHAISLDPITHAEMVEAGLFSSEELNAMLEAEDSQPAQIILNEDDVTAVHKEIVQADAREDIYAAQPVTATPLLSLAEEPVVEVAPTKKEKKPKVTGPGKRPSRLASAGSLGQYAATIVSYLKLDATDGPSEDVQVDWLIDDNIKAVKVKDKAVNLIEAIYTKRTLSTFTKAAIAHLRSHGRYDIKSMVEAFIAKGGKTASEGYDDGTARSQAQQMSSLFKTFRIINADGSQNGNSTMLQALPV